MKGKGHLSALFLLVLAGSLSATHAVDYYLSGPSYPGAQHCEALGGYYQTPRTCLILDTVHVTLHPEDTLTISSGWTLEILQYASLANEGEIHNHGLISNDYDLFNQGLVINDGTIEHDGQYGLDGFRNYSGGTITNSLGGSIIIYQCEMRNYGTLNNNSGATITNRWGRLYNHGTLNNNSGATITNEAEIHNLELIVNDGLINNLGALLVYCSAQLLGTGTVTGNPPIVDTQPDSDWDGVCDPMDCAPTDVTAFAIPVVHLEEVTHTGGVDGTTTITWVVEEQGGIGSVFEALVLLDPPSIDYALCLPDEGGGSQASYALTPAPNEFHELLVRGRNACGTYVLPGIDCP